MKVSVVIPCYYSENMITQVVHLTRNELVDAGYEYEFILVNDGSKDATFSQIEALCNEDTHIKGIDLMRNFGQHNAIMAGMREVTGDAVMLMDDDMQTHPSQCLKLISALSDGVDVVFAAFRQHRENWYRRLGSRFAMWTIRVLAGCPKGVVDSNFLVMRRCVCDVMVEYKSSSVYIQGLIFRTTDRLVNVEVEHFDRAKGKSGYTIRNLMRLWSTILNFSVTPLRAASVMGALIGGAGIVGAIYLIIERISDPTMQLGWSSTMVTILVCSGIIMLFMGVVGEYVGRLFMTTNRHPQFIVRSVRNSSNIRERARHASTNDDVQKFYDRGISEEVFPRQDTHSSQMCPDADRNDYKNLWHDTYEGAPQ